MKHKNNHIDTLLDKGLFSQALAAAQALVARTPSDAWAWLKIGRIHEAMRQPLEAKAAFSRAISLKSNLLEAYEGRSKSHIALGQFDAACSDAERVLAKQHSNINMLLVLGAAHHQAGRQREAMAAYNRVLAVQPSHPFARISLAHLLVEQGRSEDALPILTSSPVEEHPDARVLLKKSEILWSLKRYTDARTVCEEAAKIFPNDDMVRAALGRFCYETGETGDAEQWFRQAALLAPQNSLHRSHLCAVLLQLGRIEEAWVEGERAILSGQLPEAYLNLGNVHRTRGDAVTAELCYTRALAINPRFFTAFYNLGVLAQENGRFSEAESLYRECLKLDPHRPEAHTNLGVVLNILGRPIEALTELKIAARLDPGNPHRLSNVLLTALHCDDIGQEELARLHHSFGELFDKPTTPATPRRHKNKQLRIGYVSCDFKRHSVAYFLEEVWRHHDREKFQIHAYHASADFDDMTERLKSLTDHWHDIATLEDAQAIESIQDNGIDILIDLGGHTSNNRLTLFTHKAAPLQVTYLGYPATTGLQNMDARITDALADPPGQSSNTYTERLEYLSAPFLCYSPPEDAPEVVPPPTLRTGKISFGSFNKLAKLSDTTLSLWKDILTALPQATLQLKDRALGDSGCRNWLLARCDKIGLPTDRLLLIPGSPTRKEHLARYGDIDIALDTYPYHGTTTTCEALWMGVPVVTLIGQEHHSRVGLSILASLNTTSWAAMDSVTYISTALSLASDSDSLALMRKKMRENMRKSKLMDGKRLAREIEIALRKLWDS